MPCHPNTKICTHIRVAGIQCGSPALRGERFCYFHQRMLRSVPTPPASRVHPIALIEDAHAIQTSLMEIINALIRNTIDMRRAELILRALYIASRNSPRALFDMHEDLMVSQVPEYPAPPKPASPPTNPQTELRLIAEKMAENLSQDTAAKMMASALTTVGAAAALGAAAGAAATVVPAKLASPPQLPPAKILEQDATQKKPQARAGLPPTPKKVAVNQQKTRT